MEKFIMEDCGGMLRGDKKLKAVIPGGSSVYIMNAGQIIGKKVTMDYEGLVAGGSMVGSGGFIVMDETVDVMESTKNLTEFYKHESCGWCTPCREGSSTEFRPAADAPKMPSLCSTSATTSKEKAFARSATPRRGRSKVRSSSSLRTSKSGC
jgi:hypothetical protein